MTSCDVRHLLDDVFEEEALIIGGLAELHAVDGELIERLFRSLAVVRRKAHQRIDDPKSPLRQLGEQTSRSHPAIEEFLAQIGRS